MLNLQIAMRKVILLVLCLLALSTLSASAPVLVITSPQAGQVLQGNVSIMGTVPADGFVSGEVSYAYAQAGIETWFLVASLTQPVTEDVLAKWDTSTISDGDYQIKLSVKYQNGETRETIIKPVLVRNYTAVVLPPTATVAVTLVQSSIQTSTPTATPEIVATPFLANPASLSLVQVQTSMRVGIGVGVLVLLALAIYAFLRYLRFHR